MSVFALIVTGTVENTAIADALGHLGAGQWVEIDGLSPMPGIGWSYDGTSFSAPAAPTPTLPQARATASGNAAAHFASLMAAGFTSGGVLYALDSQSIANATAAGAQAGMVGLNATGFTWPAGFTYPAADGSRHAMTAAQMAALANNLFHYVAGCDQQLATIIGEIAAAANVGAVEAIDVTAGYPTASA